MQLLQGEWQAWLTTAGILLLVALGAFAGFLALRSALSRLAQRSKTSVDNSLILYSERPLSVILPLLAVFFTLPVVHPPAGVLGPLRHAIGLIMIAGTAWLIVSLTRVLDEVLAERYRLDVADNLQARHVHTQMRVLRRVFLVVLGVITLSLMLMTFPADSHRRRGHRRERMGPDRGDHHHLCRGPHLGSPPAGIAPFVLH